MPSIIARLGSLHVQLYINWSLSCMLNVCHSSLQPTYSFGANFTLGRVINACDALNRVAQKASELDRAGLKILFFFCLLGRYFLLMITKNIFPLWDNSDIILSAIKTAILVIWDKISLDTQWKDALPREICEFIFHAIYEILKLKGPYKRTVCRTSYSGNALEATALLTLLVSPTQLLSKLSDNLQRELWALRGLGEIAPLAVLSGGAAGPRQCST